MSDSLELVIVMPVFNDWVSAEKVCSKLDAEILAMPDVTACVILVDDGSTVPAKPDFLSHRLQALRSVQRLRLKRNLGHQRAIAVALAFIDESVAADAILIMDADGEDRWQDVPRLIEAFRVGGGAKAVFAERRKRLESPFFRIGYFCYRQVHRMLTGIAVKVGNFSILPRGHVSVLVVTSELWNHYAATVFKSALPLATLPTDRGQRLAGKSTMDITALVTHGFNAMSVFREIVGTRLLLATAALSALVVVLLVFVASIGLATGFSIPPWARVTGLVLVVLFLQAAILSFVLLFFILANRDNLTFLPIRDCKPFVAGLERLA